MKTINDQSKEQGNLKVFLLACLFGGVFAFIWLTFGEPWEVLADGDHYMRMYNGQMAASPFGYRILTPYLASLLPWEAKTDFALVTVSCLVLTTGVVALYGKKITGSLTVSGLTSFFWVLSFPFIYYGTTLIRADAPMFLMMAIAFLASLYGVRSPIIMAFIAIGMLSHETMLILIPALWIDKVMSTELTGGKQYSYLNLVLISLFAAAVFVAYRASIHTLPAAMSYEKGIGNMIAYVKSYSGGWIKHCLRIYAAFGPALLFATFYAAPWNSVKRAVGYFALLLCVLLLTFLATDTLRVMGVFIIPVIFFAACFVTDTFKAGRVKTAAVFLVLQLVYTYMVYGHLRTFEGSALANKLAALLSLVTLLTLLYSEYSSNEKFKAIFTRSAKSKLPA